MLSIPANTKQQLCIKPTGFLVESQSIYTRFVILSCTEQWLDILIGLRVDEKGVGFGAVKVTCKEKRCQTAWFI